METGRQNIYDNAQFFEKYRLFRETDEGLNRRIEEPTMHSLMPELSGKRVLDIGCGDGAICRYAATQGAKYVLGIDPSQLMLNAAAAKNESFEGIIEYEKKFAEEYHAAPGSFDVVVSSLAFHYIGELENLFSRISDLLSVNGTLIFSIEHPIYSAVGPDGWGKDKDGKSAWLVRDFSSEGYKTVRWLDTDVRKYHRKVCTIVNALADAGFHVTHVVETPDNEAEGGRQDIATEFARPSFLIIRAENRYRVVMQHNRGPEILLKILAGFLLAGIVAQHRRIIDIFNESNPPQEWDVATWAFIAFGANIFRQIHGLAIVTTDRRYKWNSDLNRPGVNAIALFCLLAILALPAFLLTRIVNSTGMEASPKSDWILKTYLAVALAYVVWDLVVFYGDYRSTSQRQEIRKKRWFWLIGFAICVSIGVSVSYQMSQTIGSTAWWMGVLIGVATGVTGGWVIADLSRREPSLRPRHKNANSDMDHVTLSIRGICERILGADQMRHFVINWKLILLTTLIVGAVLANGTGSIPIMLFAMCSTYTLLDYTLNRKFYFSS